MEVEYKLTPVDFDPFTDGELAKAIPVTESQQEIWLACELGADEANCAYNESVTIRLEGALNIPNLNTALFCVVERHEALRATFARHGDEMFVYYEKKPSVNHVDLSGQAAQPEQLAQLAKVDSSTPFDLQKGPLIRFHVIKLHDTEHLLRITAHHIVCDGWSFGILLEDIGQIYSSLQQTNAYELPPPESIRMYALEEKIYLQSIEYRKTEDYWLQKFADGGPVVELPVDAPRPTIRTYDGNRIDVTLEAELVEKIKTLSKTAGTNLVTTLLATFELFLRSITGQDDFVVGLPASGQAATGHFGVVGHCVNFLPIRSHIDQGKSVVDYLSQRKHELLDDLDYQRITFGSLLKKLQIPRKPGYIPLVSTVFNVDLGMDSRVSFAGLQQRLVSNPRSFENFELYVNVTGSADSTVLEWSYNTNLFNESTIQRWMQHFVDLLTRLADSPGARISTLSRDKSIQRSDIPTAIDGGNGETALIEQAVAELSGVNEVVVVEDGEQLLAYFTAKHEAHEDKQSSWKEKWDMLYDMATHANDDEGVKEQNLDLVVAEQLGVHDETVKQQAEEWMQQSIERIRALSPQHILEVGCGAGQLIFELAPFVESYIATDYAETAIDNLKNRLANNPNIASKNIVALVRDADDFSELPSQPTDLVLIHSVSQYFPNYQYLYNVIVQAVNRLKTGCVFIGDVQGKNSLPLFHASDQLKRSNPETTVGLFRQIVHNRVRLEHELTIDPGYFYLLPAFIPEITAVDVQLRKGTLDNETTQYHYDVWLFVDDKTQTIPATLTKPWESLDTLNGMLARHPDEVICITHIPNFRQHQGVSLHHFLKTAADEDTLSQFRADTNETAVHPDCLWALGEKHGYSTHVRWSADGTDGFIEAVFIPTSIGKAVPQTPGGTKLAGLGLDTFANLPYGSTAFLPKETITGWASNLTSQAPIPMKWVELYKLPQDVSDKTTRAWLSKYFPPTFPLPPQEGIKRHPSAWWADQLFQERALNTSLSVWLNTALQQHADHVALEFGDESMTYLELDQLSSRYANQLSTMGIKSGDRVGISLYRGMDLIALLVGMVRMGVSYVPLDTSFPKQRLADITDQADLKYVVVHQVLLHQYGTQQSVIALEEFISHAQSASDQLQNTRVSENSATYVLHTSGSTGKPKGVTMGQRALTNLLLWQREHSDAGRGTKTLQFAPITFDVSFQEIFATLTTGGILCLIPEEMRYDIPALLRHIDNERINRIFLPFVALHALAESGCSSQVFPNCINEVITAGEQLKITEQVATFFSKIPQATLSNQYGPTETHVVTALKLDGDPLAWPALPSIGKPIYNTKIHLLDEHQRPVGVGEIGELVVEGVALADGYLGAPQLTAERFANISLSNKTVRTYRTGDLAEYDNQGNLIFHGRSDSQVKIRGYRVELGEIETELVKLESIAEAAVVLGNDNAGIPRLTGYVRMENQQKPASDSEIRTTAVTEVQMNAWKLALARTLPDYMIPHAIVAISHFPLTRSGKIDRKALPSLIASPTESVPKVIDFVAPRNETERFLAEMWKETLGLDMVSIHSNFFELGGYSLIAVKVMLAIEKHRGVRLPLSTLFENPTIEKLAKLISGDDEQIKWDSLVPIQTTGTKPPIYLVHGGGLNVLVFQSMAQYLDDDQPVYAMQALGLNGETTLFDNMEEIAEKYIQEILTVNPDGPYYLAGYSLGGKIVYEMAKQLLEMNKEVGMVGIFDTVGSNNGHEDNWWKYLGQKFARQFRKIPFFVKSFLSYPSETLAYQRLILMEKIKKAVNDKTHNNLESFTYNEDIPISYLNAYDNYRIEPLDIEIDLFRVTKRLYFLDDLKYLGWNAFAKRGVKVHDVPGDHRTFILPPYDKVLAAVLQDCLNKKVRNEQPIEENIH